MAKTRKVHLTKTKVADLKADIEKNRKEYIGGSDIGSIMGVSPWKSAYTLWAEKTGLITPEDISDKESVWWGEMEEDLVARRFTMKTDLKVKKSNYAYSCEEYPYLRGHIDRIGAGNKFGLECKTTSARNPTNYADNEVPPYHWWQCQFYMFVTGISEWYLATKKDNQFYISHIFRDDEAIDQMLIACEDFWEHVQSGEPVEIDSSDSTANTLREMYPEEVEGTICDLQSEEDYFYALDTLSAQKKNIEAQAEEYKNHIKSIMKDSERGDTTHWAVTWKANRSGTRVFKITKKKEVEEKPL